MHLNMSHHICQRFRPSKEIGSGKNPPANAGDMRDTGLISRLRRSSGGGHGNPLQFSCLENPIDRGAWKAIVYGVTKSQT